MKRSALTRTTPLRVKPAAGILRTAHPVPGKPTLASKPRLRKCAICKTPFTPRGMTHKACSPDCAIVVARLAREKRERKELAVRKQASKTLGQRLKEAEKEVNRYVRLRDRYLGCISCDKPAHWGGQWHASHFKSVGSNSTLRFHLWNIHRACAECNLFLSGNLVEYTKRLCLKIGQEKVEWLHSQNGVRKYTPDYLVRLRQVFKRRADRIQKKEKQ